MGVSTRTTVAYCFRATPGAPRPAAEPVWIRARAVAGRGRASRAGEEEADAGLPGACVYRRRPDVAAARVQGHGLGAAGHGPRSRRLRQPDARVRPHTAGTRVAG